MEYNGVVREFFPEGAPVLLQGFYFDDDSDLLENPDDPLDQMVFEKDIRDRTSRFILIFKKKTTNDRYHHQLAQIRFSRNGCDKREAGIVLRESGI